METGAWLCFPFRIPHSREVENTKYLQGDMSLAELGLKESRAFRKVDREKSARKDDGK